MKGISTGSSLKKLIIAIVILGALIGIGFAIYAVCKFGVEKTFSAKGLLPFAFPFCMTMILSLFVLLPARYYRVFSIVDEIFTICSTKRDDDSEERQKSFAFIKAIIGHILILCGAIYIFCDALAQ